MPSRKALRVVWVGGPLQLKPLVGSAIHFVQVTPSGLLAEYALGALGVWFIVRPPPPFPHTQHTPLLILLDRALSAQHQAPGLIGAKVVPTNAHKVGDMCRQSGGISALQSRPGLHLSHMCCSVHHTSRQYPC